MIGGEEIYGTKLVEVVFIVFCLMFAINVAYFIYRLITDCIRKQRIKQAEKKKQERLASMKEKKEEAQKRAENQDQAPSDSVLPLGPPVETTKQGQAVSIQQF